MSERLPRQEPQHLPKEAVLKTLGLFIPPMDLERIDDRTVQISLTSKQEMSPDDIRAQLASVCTTGSGKRKKYYQITWQLQASFRYDKKSRQFEYTVMGTLSANPLGKQQVLELVIQPFSKRLTEKHSSP